MKQALVTQPLQTPRTLRRAATMAQQGDFKTGEARRIGGERVRRTGARPPAGDGGAGRRSGLRLFKTDAQQKQGDAGLFRSPRQPQSGGKIQHGRRPKNFNQGGAETLAARRLDPGAQHGLRVAPPHKRQQSGVDAKFRKTDAIQPPGLFIEKIRPRPKQRPCRRGAAGQGETKAGRGRPIGPGRMDFMQGGAVQTTAKKTIHFALAQSEGRLAFQRNTMSKRNPGELQTQVAQNFDARHPSPRA